MTEYKLLSFANDRGPRSGLLVGDSVYDIADTTGRSEFLTLEGVLADWLQADALLQTIADSAPRGGVDVSHVRVLAPITRPGAIYCAGANYQEHINNMARKQGVELGTSPRDLGLPPFHFMKSVHCIVGTGAGLPIVSDALDYEGELVAVIGRDAVNVSTDDALDYVAGYTVANDLSARDRFVRHDIPFSSPFRYDWLGHKNFNGSCPTGPYIVPARFIRDPQNLRLRTWVNDEIRQDASTGGMVYPLAELIAALSAHITLRPGDLVLTGTPAGVGAESGNFLRSGDVVKVEIEGIGQLVNRVGDAVDDRQKREPAATAAVGRVGVG